MRRIVALAVVYAATAGILALIVATLDSVLSGSVT